MPSLALLLASVLALTAYASADTLSAPRDIFYEKKLSREQKLTVSAAELAKQEADQLIEKIRQEVGPKAGRKRLILPDRFVVYSFALTSVDGKLIKALWKTTVAEYVTSGLPTNFRILDVAFEGKPGILVVVCKEGGWTTAQVIRLEQPKEKNSIQPASNPPEMLEKDSDAFGVVVASAVIQGSSENGNLAIVTKKKTGETARFFWKNGKWESEKLPPPVEVKPPPPRPARNDPDASYRGILVFGDAFAKPTSLVVVRNRLRPAPLSKADAKTLPPGIEVSRTNEFVFSFRYLKGTSTKVLWTYQVQSDSAEEAAAAFQVLDAAYKPEEDVLAFVFNQGGSLHANVVRSGARGGYAGLPWNDTKLNIAPELAAKVTGASLEGSSKEGTLAVSLKGEKGVVSRFVFQQDKWIETR